LRRRRSARSQTAIRGRAFVKAAIALPQIVPNAPLRPLEWLTPPARREHVVLDSQGDADALRADLYRPAGSKRRPGIVMALGANDLGSRDPRAVALADAFARSGFVVLVMSGAATLIAPDGNDPADLVRAPSRAIAAFNYLAQRSDVDAELVGFVGVCLGGGTCLLAASQPALAARVAFLFLIGPYFSLRSLLQCVVSGTSNDLEGRVRPWNVRPYAAERMRAWLLQALAPAERTRVRCLIADAQAPPVELSPAASATLLLCRGVVPECADRLIERLGDQFLSMLADASPKDHLQHLRAPTFIMHGVDDGLIPVDESRRLAQALHGQVALRCVEFELFDHVDATRQLRAAVLAREVWRLAGHVAPLMQYVS
jgi:pimeloyl-ACP methyl ester carboxylesterase